AIFAVGRKHLHTRSVRQLDTGFLLKGFTVKYSDIILTAHSHPDFTAVRSKKNLVRRAPDISGVLYDVGCGIDEGDGIRADRHHSNGPVVRRIAQPMYQHLTVVERTEIARLRIAQPDHTEQRIACRIGNRNRVGKLLSRVDSVPMTDGNIRIGRRTRRLTRPTGCRRGKDRNGGYGCTEQFTDHSTLLFHFHVVLSWCCYRRWQLLTKGQSHGRYLLLLIDDNFLGDATQLFIFAVV